MKKKPEGNTDVIRFGKHKGRLWSDVPTEYLRWILSQDDSMRSSTKEIAREEIKRRRAKLPLVHIPYSVIDQASLTVLDEYWKSHTPGEGFHSWLVRMTLEALDVGETYGMGAHCYLGMKLTISPGRDWPILTGIKFDGARDRVMVFNTEINL